MRNPCFPNRARMLAAVLIPAACASLSGNPRAEDSPPPSGRPWKRHTIDASSRGADGVRLADVNGDGLLDIVTGWEEGGVTRVYLNPGPTRARQAWPAVTVGETPSVEDAVFVDLDGDGAVDVVSSTEGASRSMFFHWAPREPEQYSRPAAWRTEALPASRGMMQWMFCAPVQLDGRHGIDLAAGGKGPSAALGWWEAPANPRSLEAWAWHPLRPLGWLMSLVAADMDGDGDPDLLFTDRKGPRSGCFWLENPGPGPAQKEPWKEHAIGGAGLEMMFLTRADLDGDGLEDVIAAQRPDSLLFFGRLDRAGRRWSTHRLPLPPNTGGAKAVTAGDVDGDGRPDLVFTCEGAAAGRHGVMRLSYRKSPLEEQWQPHVIGGPDGIKHDLVELIDLDGDGDPDVLTCEETKNLGIFWYENPAR